MKSNGWKETQPWDRRALHASRENPTIVDWDRAIANLKVMLAQRQRKQR